MKSLVFDATGFLGAWAVSALAQSDRDAVVVVMRQSSDTWRTVGLPATDESSSRRPRLARAGRGRQSRQRRERQ